MHRHFEKDNIAKCASTVVRNTIQWVENFTISPANEKDLHNLFGHCSTVSTFAAVEEREIFVEPTHSLFYLLKRALFFMRTQPMAAARSRARLSPLDANKSRNSDVPNTRGFRVCRWNLISAAFVTKLTVRAFFALFHSVLLLLPHYSFFALVSQCDRGIGRETRSLLKIHDRIEQIGKALQIELNSSIYIVVTRMHRLPIWSSLISASHIHTFVQTTS